MPVHRAVLAVRPVLLVLRALGLGDLLTAVPALRALAAAFPEHHRILAAPAPLAPIARLTGALDELAATAELAPLDPALAGADVAVNLHGRGPRSHRILLAARPARLLAFAHPELRASAAGPAWDEGEHEVRRWCRLLAASGIQADPTDLDLPWPPPWAASTGPGMEAPAGDAATLIHPGAASRARCWPAERYAAVARSEAEAGRAVLITGGPGEVGLARTVAGLAGLPGTAVHAGTTDLLQLAGLVASAGRVVCGDTGVAHLATALGTPSVVLFGPTSPALWGPPPDRPWHRALWAGCPGDPHGSSPDLGLLRISVAEVRSSLATLPGRPPRRRPWQNVRPDGRAQRAGERQAAS
jgi:ADP-heptose:LPS heptosyltransferase